jgi:alpha-D-ribose 1-methylphosphonate 5-triphosphate diphosphatase
MDHTPGQRQWRDLDKWRLFLSQFRDPSIDSPAQLARRRELQDRFAVANRRTVVEACRLRHIPLASHDDTTAAHVEEAAADGIAISEFPTTLEAAALAQGKGIATVMGSPNVVNRRSHSGNVSAFELARHGLVDVLASDYVPHSLMHAVFALHREVEISLPDAVATVSRTPANLLGLKDRGVIECGRRADLARVALAPDGTPVVRSVWRAGQRVN